MSEERITCTRGCLGWAFINSGIHGLQVQKCDECNIFETDEDAAAYIESMFKDMAKLLESIDQHALTLGLGDQCREVIKHIKYPGSWENSTPSSYIHKEPVQAYRADMYCMCLDEDEEEAIYKPTGDEKPDGAGILYHHICTNCGREEWYNHKFPHIIYRTSEGKEIS